MGGGCGKGLWKVYGMAEIEGKAAAGLYVRVIRDCESSECVRHKYVYIGEG